MEHQWGGDETTADQVTYLRRSYLRKDSKSHLSISNWTEYIKGSYKETVQILLMLQEDNGCMMNDAMEGQKLNIKNIFVPNRTVLCG